MAIVRWRPFEELDEFLEHYGKHGVFDFATDISEDENHVYVEMNTAGIDPESIDIQVHDNILRVHGTRAETYEEEDKHFTRKEIRRGSFEREITLPCPVENGNRAQAEYAHGMLKITLPKEKGKKPSKIKITKK